MVKNVDEATAPPTHGPPALRPGTAVRPPRIAVMDVGLGMLATASEVRRLRPDADLVLATDPDGMPWGVRTPQDLTARALLVAGAAAAGLGIGAYAPARGQSFSKLRSAAAHCA